MDEKQRSTHAEEQTRTDESSDTLFSLLSEASDPADFQIRVRQLLAGKEQIGREGGHKNCPNCH